MNGPAIDIAELRVAAGGREILRVERLTVPAGEVFVVLGPNGAGKSTLLNCCIGLTRPAAGQVEVLGEPVRRLSPAGLCRLRRRIGYVPQVLAERSEVPLTVREVVAIGRTGVAGLLRPLRREDWQIVDQWIDRLGLGELAEGAYADLSGGEQRKTLLAKAMAQQPELLILDEPTANLDLFWREQIVATLQQLYEQTRLTVVLVCHELEVIPPCAERLLLLTDGLVAGAGPIQQVLTAERIRALYGAGLTLLRRGRRLTVVPAEGAVP